MNNPFSSLRARIDLTVEPPFQLGSLRVSPATLEIVSAAGVSSIEPRVMQVLVALHRHRGEAVSRDELADLCWDGRIVGDDALNRSISRLRRALAGEPSVAVDTIPKMGYRLREGVVADAQTAHAGPNGGTDRKGRRVPWPAISAAVLAVVLALGGAWAWSRGRSPWTATELRPLTRDAGVETQPALSPQGQWLVYAAGPGFGAPRDLYLKAASLDALPIRIAATAGDEHGPAWSPDGRTLAFVRSTPNEPCAILVTVPPGAGERMVGRCRGAAGADLAWIGAGRLVFVESGAAPRRLYSLDVDNGAVHALTSPPQDSLGDGIPVGSPNGRWLAFRRAAALGAEEVRLLDLKSGVERSLTTDGRKAAGLGWSADSRTLFFTSNKGGDFGLWSLGLSARTPVRVTVGMVPLGRLSVDGENRVALEAAKTRIELVAWDGAGFTTLAAPQGTDWDPDMSHDGTLVYGSDAGGANELWLRRPGEAPRQLTRLDAGYLYSPRWSPDGGQVAFLAVVGGRSDVYVVRGDGGGLRRITSDGLRKGTVAWTTDHGLIYSARTQGRWRLHRVDDRGAPGGPAAGGDGVVVLRRAPDGRLFARTDRDALIRRYDPAAGRLLNAPRDVASTDFEGWAVGRDGVYRSEPRFDGTSVLWLSPWRGRDRQLAVFRSPYRNSVALRPSDGAPLVARMVSNDIDVLALALTR